MPPETTDVDDVRSTTTPDQVPLTRQDNPRSDTPPRAIQPTAIAPHPEIPPSRPTRTRKNQCASRIMCKKNNDVFCYFVVYEKKGVSLALP